MDNHSCTFQRPTYECPHCGLHITEYAEALEDRCEAAEAQVKSLRRFAQGPCPHGCPRIPGMPCPFHRAADQVLAGVQG